MDGWLPSGEMFVSEDWCPIDELGHSVVSEGNFCFYVSTKLDQEVPERVVF